jgi:hypothetical protein
MKPFDEISTTSSKSLATKLTQFSRTGSAKEGLSENLTSFTKGTMDSQFTESNLLSFYEAIQELEKRLGLEDVDFDKLSIVSEESLKSNNTTMFSALTLDSVKGSVKRVKMVSPTISEKSAKSKVSLFSKKSGFSLVSEFSVRTFGIAKDSKFDSVICLMYDAIENLKNKMTGIAYDIESSTGSDMKSIQSSKPS